MCVVGDGVYICSVCVHSARRRVATRKMKQTKHGGSKEADELDLDEENEELFREMGRFSKLLTRTPHFVCIACTACAKTVHSTARRYF